MGKHHREKFTYGVSCKAKVPLEIVHRDLCGPMQTPSLNGNVYFMTFIDDYSRKTWVYLLKHKSQSFDMFKRFKAMVEKESGEFIKVLILDRRGEYMSKEFMELCQYYGIKRQFTARYTLNRTIMNMARSMMKEKYLSNEYWGDVFTCSVYILNRIPRKSVKD